LGCQSYHTPDDGNGGDGLQYTGFLQSHDTGDSLRDCWTNKPLLKKIIIIISTVVQQQSVIVVVEVVGLMISICLEICACHL